MRESGAGLRVIGHLTGSALNLDRRLVWQSHWVAQ